LRLLDNFVEGFIQNQALVEGSAGRILSKSDRGGGVCLRVAINEERWLLRGSEASRQVHCGGCLPNATFLISNGDNSCQRVPQTAKT